MEKLKHIGERKTMLVGESDIQTVVGSRRLQFEVKSAAKALAQRQSPRFIDSSAKGSVDYQLHSTAFIKKPFGNDGRLRRYVAEHHAAFESVLNQLLGAGEIEPAFLSQPTHAVAHRWEIAPSCNRNYILQAIADLFPQLAELLRQFFGTRRSFATPERHAWRRAVRIFD